MKCLHCDIDHIGDWHNMAELGVKKVIKIAILSRLFALLVQSISNNLLIDYDTSVEHYPCHANTTTKTSHDQNTTIDRIISTSLAGLSKWDAVYFLDIAQHGYQYEQNMAFFPLLPLSVYTFGLLLRPMQILLNFTDKSRFLLSATFINTVAFTMAAVGLYLITWTIFHNQKLAKRAVTLFCFNPASVFFSAAYSESIFAMTQFWGMLFLEQKPRRYLYATLMFSLGAGTRSNGIISCGFIGYKFLQEVIALHLTLKSEGENTRTIVTAVTQKIIKMISLLSLVLLPFALFQYYGYKMFCHNPQASPWCKSNLPLPYSYIQKQYWKVGFLKYYELKQIPNFLLAMPIVIMSVVGTSEYLARQKKRDILYLGLAITKKSSSLNIFVYVIHLGFLVAFGVTSMHVQVITRFIASSSPMVYWIAVSWTTSTRNEDNKFHSKLKANFIYTYFLLYYCLGYLLHCNFYPWT